MPRFDYIAKDKEGKRQVGSEEAATQDVVINRLQDRGFFVVKVVPEEQLIGKPFRAKKTHHFTHERIRLDDLLIFSRQLSTMVEAGVTLLRSLEVILEQVDSRGFHNCLKQVKADIERGLSLSNAFSKHPKVFNQFWVSLAEVGEASGTLPVVMNRLAFYLEQESELKGKLKTAMIYPAILITACVGALTFFAYMVIPKFQNIFASFGGKLPLLTQIVLTVFTTFREKIVLIVIGVFLAVYLVYRYINTPFGRKQFEKFLFNLPILGNFFKTVVMERFTSQMAILIECGVPILYALEISQRMVVNKTMEGAIEQVKTDVREGQFLAASMGKSGYFTPMAIQMVLIGEETGELGEMLKRAATLYQYYVTTFINRLTAMFEPFMIIVVALFVGTVIISMFLPIFDISTLGGGRGLAR